MPRRRPASSTPSSTTRSSATTRNGGEPRRQHPHRLPLSHRPGRLRRGLADARSAPTARPITDPAGNGDQQTNPDNPFFASRPPLVATFVFNGEEVTIVNNHFTSKGGSAPLLGSDQPPFNAGEVQRAAQAQAVNNFVDGLLAADPDAKVDGRRRPQRVPSSRSRWQVLKGTATHLQLRRARQPIRSTRRATTPPAAPRSCTTSRTAAGRRALRLRVRGQFADARPHAGHRRAQEGAQFDVVRINAEFADQTSDHDPLMASFEIEITDAELRAAAPALVGRRSGSAGDRRPRRTSRRWSTPSTTTTPTP